MQRGKRSNSSLLGIYQQPRRTPRRNVCRLGSPVSTPRRDVAHERLPGSAPTPIRGGSVQTSSRKATPRSTPQSPTSRSTHRIRYRSSRALRGIQHASRSPGGCPHYARRTPTRPYKVARSRGVTTSRAGCTWNGKRRTRTSTRQSSEFDTRKFCANTGTQDVSARET